jgi:hypothetical protein
VSLSLFSPLARFGESVKLKEDLDDGDKEVRCERFFCALALCDYCPHCIFDVLL